MTYLSFDIGGERLALPTRHAIEVIHVSTVRRVPHAPKSIKGIINFRGEIVPVVDLHQLCQLEKPGRQKVKHRFQPLIITELSFKEKVLRIGCLVSRVCDVISVDPKNILPADDFTSQEDACISGFYRLDEGFVKLLNFQYLLSSVLERTMW